MSYPSYQITADMQTVEVHQIQRPALCPLCFSNQVQVCIDYNNRAKDWCRCRECKCQAPAAIWNKNQEQLR